MVGQEFIITKNDKSSPNSQVSKKKVKGPENILNTIFCNCNLRMYKKTDYFAQFREDSKDRTCANVQLRRVEEDLCDLSEEFNDAISYYRSVPMIFFKLSKQLVKYAHRKNRFLENFLKLKMVIFDSE